jgi:hypothetical protein
VLGNNGNVKSACVDGVLRALGASSREERIRSCKVPDSSPQTIAPRPTSPSSSAILEEWDGMGRSASSA